MSIWVSHETIGKDPYHDDGERPEHDGGVRSYATGWSNHYPTTDGDVERNAHMDLASIPPWCVPGHHDELVDARGPWLRLCVYSWEHDWHNPSATVGAANAAVVMDEDAARELHRQLGEWLSYPKVHPQ